MDQSQIDYEWWNLIINAFRLITSLFVVVIGAVLAHKYWKTQKQIENEHAVEKMRYDSKVEASKAIWALLEYFSEKEYPKTIIVNRGTKEKPEFYCRIDRAKRFIQDLPRVYFKKGYGALLTDEVENKMMTLRTKFYRLIEAELRKDAILQNITDEDAFSTLEGFYKMVDERESKLIKIKNPTFREDVKDTSSALRQYLQHQLTKSQFKPPSSPTSP